MKSVSSFVCTIIFTNQLLLTVGGEESSCSQVNNLDEEECTNRLKNVNETSEALNNVYECVKKPWVAVIMLENPEAENDDLESLCLGSIISQRYILSTASCFCNKNIKGVQCKWNDATPGEQMENGQFIYEGGTTGSRIGYEFYDFVRIVIPGHIKDYRLDSIRRTELSNELVIHKAVEVTIHPEYVESTRPNSDLAVIKLERDLQLSAGHVMPICLPGPEFVDLDIEGKVTGWGTLYEKYKEKNQVGCHTNNIGPAKFSECRETFILEGDVMHGCSNSAPPSKLNEDCAALHAAIPESQSVHAEIQVEGDTLLCFPSTNVTYGWCATCLKEAKEGEIGNCKYDELIHEDDDEYSSVSYDKGWGMCDEKCLFSTRELLYSDFIEEISVHVMGKQACLSQTTQETDPNYKPRVDRELCALKKQNRVNHVYKKEESTFTKIEELTSPMFGGSESCQGDSGSSLYVVGQDKVPILIGIASRATNCAQDNVNVIYTRIIHFLDWINSVTKGDL